MTLFLNIHSSAKIFELTISEFGLKVETAPRFLKNGSGDFSDFQSIKEGRQEGSWGQRALLPKGKGIAGAKARVLGKQ